MKINEDFLPLVISPTEPQGKNRKKIWIQDTDTDKKIYIKNSNDVYEEFIKKSEKVTDYTGLISSVEIGNFQKKQISSSIYGYKLQINLIGNFTKNTEYHVFSYPFPIAQAGTIVRDGNTHQIGSYIINGWGFWVNFSEDITASTANKIPCTTMTAIGF